MHYARLYRTGTLDKIQESNCLWCDVALGGTTRRKYCSEACTSHSRTPRRTCLTCGKSLDGSNTRLFCSSPDDSQSRCYRLGRRAKLRDMVPSELLGMYIAQESRCAICGKAEPDTPSREETLHVDHDHVTGAVRGLLCSTCNVATGMLKDDPALARKVAEYLEQVAPLPV